MSAGFGSCATDPQSLTGNPYKDLISDLQKRGVKVELCGATAKAHGWRNEWTVGGGLERAFGQRVLLVGVRVHHEAQSSARLAHPAEGIGRGCAAIGSWPMGKLHPPVELPTKLPLS